MKAIKVKHPASLNNLQVSDIEDLGRPGKGQIRVRIHASSLNFHDYLVATGAMPTLDGRIPMSDGAGVVEAVGEDVKEFTVGDYVVSCFFPTWLNGEATIGDFSSVPGDGVEGYAREMVITPSHYFTLAPQKYSHIESATLTTAGLTAWRALVVNGQLKAGDTVLILGTGGVSIFALQFAKMMGATVIATSSSDKKLARLRLLGADHTINYKTQPNWGEEIIAITHGKGVDHIVEVGGPATLSQSITAIKVGGHISLIGVLTGISGEIPTMALMAKQAKLQGLIVGSRQHQMDMIKAIDANGLKPIIDKVFVLDEIAEAFRYQETGAHFGKICLEL